MIGRLDRATLNWFALLALTLVMLAFRDRHDWLITYPADWVVPLIDVLNVAMKWLVDTTGWFFRGVSFVLDIPMTAVQVVLQWLPWPAVIALTAVAAHAAAGWRLVVFTVVSLLYMVVVGYWSESMNSLSLVAISVPLAILIGFVSGVWGYFSPRAERFILPILDLLQTVPAFAYLLPILMLFGFGPVVGLIASVLFAFPPMVRNTMLGLRRVPPEVIESGLMSGATGMQLFWQVQVPTARRQILLGVNQTTMAAFSMVIIASIIGGTADIGWEVIQSVRKARFGESLLAGIVIALMAMVMDRISAGLATRETTEWAHEQSFTERYERWLIAGALTLSLFALALFIPLLNEWPEAWELYPAKQMNDALTWFVVTFQSWISAFKTMSFFYVMLPTKVGLEQTISPFSWGFEFTTPMKLAYGAGAAALTGWALRRGSAQAAIAIAFFAILFFFGLTRLPWPALLAMATYLAYRLGGMQLAIGTFAGLGFLLIVGVWPQAMLSVYLCGIAVVISFAIGATLGIWAAHSERVSAFLRPINDTMQTMPLFVILIPFVMIFKIGEFSALLSIIAYAFVPAIRYAEHGLRNLPKDVIEAATCMGCTTWQLLWQVKLPLALPVMMLGLNQTIMYGIAMLVIAALVGTNGLGQQVYIGLGNGDFGVGIIAGFGMAIIAIIADRMTQSWSRSRQEAFGLA
ncbi:MAG: ABC transporter permease subunit [Rhizobiales bacterium]|nr:ABC transporter permease subunit [Hyphomicrobiales bacterium]